MAVELRKTLPRAPKWHSGLKSSSRVISNKAVQSEPEMCIELTCDPVQTIADNDPMAAVPTCSASTDAVITEPKHVSLLEISPYPSTSRSGQVRKRTRAAESSAVLTASPYKEKLIQKSAKQNKKRKNVVESKQAPKPKKPRNKQNSSAKANMKRASCEQEQEVVLCTYCNEPYHEPPEQDWVACSKCGSWSHELCAPMDPGEEFLCAGCL